MNKINIYESFLHKMQMYYSVVLNGDKVKEGLDIIDGWSYAHRIGNGMYSEEEQEEVINKWLKKMQEF